MAELIRREEQRGNRSAGEAAYHLRTHDYCVYDLEIDSTQPLQEQVQAVLAGWKARALVRRELL